MSEIISNKSNNVQAKNVDIRAHNVKGGALTVTNDLTQTEGDLVKITGKAGQSALNVSSGNVAIAGELTGFRREVLRQTVFTTSTELTVAQSGALVLLDNDGATTITLPAVTSSDIGVTYTIMETVASDLLRKIVTKYNNDYFVGGVTNLFDAAKTDGSTGGIAFVSAGATNTTINLAKDDLANAGGGLGAMVTLTAILTGNIEVDGGPKLVWAVTGNKVAQVEADTGAAFFA